MKRRLGFRIFAGLCGLILLLVVAQGLRQAPAAADDSKDPRADQRPKEFLRAAASIPEPQGEPLTQAPPHPSLLGTDVNGGIRVDAKGRIVLHRDIRRLFDYYLSLRGRMDRESIRALLRQHLEASQKAAVVAASLAVFDQYVSLIDTEAQYAADWTQRDLKAAEQVTKVLEERRHLRREILGEDMATAFFEDEERYEAFQLERMAIANDNKLSPDEKAAALVAAESRLTPEQREMRQQTFAWLDIKQHARQPIESLDVESAAAIRQRFGDNALDRLAAAQQESRSWDEKREAWLAEKARLAALSDLSDAERKERLLDYGRTQLEASEIRRMQALDEDM